MKFGGISMDRDISFTEIPHIEEILDFLPIFSNDQEDVNAYIQNIKSLVHINYRYEQYQFAYFGVHLLYMTYVYCTAWKISKMCEERYSDAIIFAQLYRGKNIDLRNVDSVFQYSLLPEKEIGKLFYLIGLDKGQIDIISGLVDDRNEMAHASGKIKIPNDLEFEVKAKTVLTSMTNVHNSMKWLIRKWFKRTLVDFCQDVDKDFDTYENIVCDFNLSVKEVSECVDMSIKEVIKNRPLIENKLKKHKNDLKNFYDAFYDI